MNRTVISLLVLIFFATCSSKTEINDDKSLFKRVPSDYSGINFTNQLESQPDLSIVEYLYFYNGGGVAAGDINNDGLEDLFFTSNQGTNRLYLNKGNLKFEDISEKSGIADHKGWSTGVVIVDVDGDGLRDIYVCQVNKFKSLEGHNLLFINDGDLSFTESAKVYGLDFSGFSTHSAFLDYDLDGDLDMYLLNHSIHTRRSYRSADTRNEFDELAGDRFFESLVAQGEKRFVDISAKTGIYQSSQGYGLGIVAADLNDDGWTDIYIGNDFHENDYLYINQRNKTFKELLTQKTGHTSRFTMGVDAGFINDDEQPDIFTLDMLPYDANVLLKSAGEDPNKVAEIKLRYGYAPQMARNNFQLNKGNGSFSEIALLTETYATDWSWSVLLQDYNNDTRTDIFITNGIFKRPNDLDYINYLSNINLTLFSEDEQDSVERELIKRMPTLKIPNFLYLNRGDLNFENDPAISGFQEGSYSNGAVYSDLDNDGDLDLAINNINQEAFLMENNTDTVSFIRIKLKGPGLNTDGIGSKVVVYFEGKATRKEVSLSRGFMSGVSSALHFGLGTAKKIDSLDVIWMNGSVKRFFELRVDTTYVFHGDEGVKVHSANKTNQSFFEVIKSPINHTENRYNDYEQEPLIPHKISREGPALATGDINNDGNLDFYIGGSHGFPGKLFIHSPEGFEQLKIEDFISDQSYEDVDAVFVDLEGDGDLDLYVVSGGNEFEERSLALQDRIYINDNGTFSRLNTPLPTYNGSCVAPVDLDADGDMDFFVGSRSVPGAYGVVPESVILENRNNRFLVKERFTPGMVTDAEWADLTGDGHEELIMAGEWMPVSIFSYGTNGLEDETKKWGLDSTNGWWNRILVQDINGDGQLDLIGGNLGLNSKLKADKSKPVNLYVADFDFNGAIDPIMFYYRGNESVPFATRDELVGQLPMLKKNFLNYEKFSGVRTLRDLMDGFKIPEDLINHKVFELRSGTFINRGNRFEFAPFEKEGQFGPIQDFEMTDVDHDGLKDLLMIGNFLGPVSSFGQYDALNGAFFTKNKGDDYTFSAFLPLPDHISYRKIKVLKDKLVVVTNDENLYFLKFVENRN